MADDQVKKFVAQLKFCQEGGAPHTVRKMVKKGKDLFENLLIDCWVFQIYYI